MQNQFLAQCIGSAHAANAQGQYAVAVGWCQQAMRLAPNLPEALFNLGVAYLGLGQREDALLALKKSAKLTRDNPDAQNSLGFQLLEMGAWRDAEQCLKRALVLAPGFAFAHSNLGMLYQKQQRLEEAELSFRRALKLQPELAAIHVNLSGLLNLRKKHEQAEAAARQALDLDPRSAAAWINLCSALAGQKRYLPAEAAVRRAIDVFPESPVAWGKLGAIQVEQDKHQDAVGSFSRSLVLDSQGYQFLGDLMHSRMHLCDWREFDREMDVIKQRISEERRVVDPFSMLALTTDLALNRKVAELCISEECPECGDPVPSVKSARQGRIRIGYYSGDFHNHATTYLMAELFELHDKTRFELIGFSFGPDIKDEMRQRVSAALDQFIDVRDHSDRDVAELSRNMGIDIAIDLKGYTRDCRPGIFAHRAAPVQVNYLGFPGTMGAAFMDYIVADPTLIPPASQCHYSEKIVYLPDSYQVNDRKRTISKRLFSREELGLPATGFVFACFNNNFKITPPTFAGWMRILKQVEGSVLWLFEANSDAVSNLCKEAGRHGIDPCRLVFAKRLALSEHLARIRLADLFLDTLPCNAHTTTSDALWAGLPVLTCVGESFASRVAASLLNAIDLPELITSSQQDYESLAVALASDPAQLAIIRQKLARNRDVTPLFDSGLFTRHIEAAYAAIHDRCQAGLPPEHIHIECGGA